MLDNLFPRQFDNVFRGLRPALWLFVPCLLIELSMGGNALLMPRYIAMSADAIPLAHYSKDAADTVVSLFAMLGFFRVLLVLLGVVALIRYRAMIPLLYLVFMLMHAGSKALLAFHPIVKSGVDSAHASSAVVYTLICVLLLGLVLSLLRRPHSIAQ